MLLAEHSANVINIDVVKLRTFNWPLWAGLLLSILAFLSYPALFVDWPLTRDFPWANLLLFALALVLLFMGVRRAFAPERRRISRFTGVAVATLSLLILGLFLFTFLVVSRWMPDAKGAPQPGQQAPDFTLADTTGRMVSLAELRTAPINGKAPRGVLLIFYRGYW